jgi:hypothetical protein
MRHTSCRSREFNAAHFAGGGIPDAAAIHAARKKRELMRAKGGAEDFLPIKPAKKAPEEANKKIGKRLVREEDEEEEVRGLKFGNI